MAVDKNLIDLSLGVVFSVVGFIVSFALQRRYLHCLQFEYKK